MQLTIDITQLDHIERTRLARQLTDSLAKQPNALRILKADIDRHLKALDDLNESIAKISAKTIAMVNNRDPQS